jgi:DegV family protein with EDD domain
MSSQTALVTDSTSYIPTALRERFGIRTVSLHVELAGKHLRESDIDLEGFYGQLGAGVTVTTSQPSPGEFLEAYHAAADSGAREVLSVHIGSNVSGTVQSARIAAESAKVPVTIVDTAQASFAEGLCVLAAAEALERGATSAEAAALATAASRTIGNTFVVRGLELVRRGGRLAAGETTDVAGVPVMALTEDGMKVLASVTSVDEAIAAMSEHVRKAAEAAGARRLRVGIGHGVAPEIAAALKRNVQSIRGVSDVIDYLVGPVVGAHVGPGNAGAVFMPVPVSVS